LPGGRARGGLGCRCISSRRTRAHHSLHDWTRLPFGTLRIDSIEVWKRGFFVGVEVFDPAIASEGCSHDAEYKRGLKNTHPRSSRQQICRS
jgi:hypothetical protein